MKKTVVITSGTSGIGRGIVEQLFQTTGDEVERLFVNYGHHDQAAQDLLSSLSPSDAQRVTFIKSDMSDEAGLTHFLEELLSYTDHVDWLILNTGIGTYLPFEQYSFELWNKVMTTNVTVPAFLVQKLRPYMRENGKILFMGSHAGNVPYSSSLVYGTSKAAVHFMARSLMKYFDDKHVCINAVAPGFIETPWQKDRTDESRQRINAKIAAHRFGTPQEVAAMAISILKNDYVNGTVVEVTGGYDYF